MTPLEADEFEFEGARRSAGGGFLSSIPTILFQRKWFIIIPVVLGVAAAAAASFLIPAEYQSRAVLLVESSQLQTDGNGQVSAGVIDERIAKVRQQVLSRPDLIAVVQELQLYPDRRAGSSLSQIVEDMREAIVIEPVSAQIQQRSGARAQTIAFELSFNYPAPSTAQAVTQRLVERMLEVDANRAAEQASDSVRFLTGQVNGIRERMNAIEQNLTAINSQNGRALSAQGMMIGGTGNLDAQIAMLERENSQLRAQREAVRASAPRDPGVMQAESVLAALRAVYSEAHPDIAIAKQRLAEAKILAEKNIANLPFDTVASQIETNNGQLSILRAARAREAAQASEVLSAQVRAPLVQQQVTQLQQQLSGLDEQYQEASRKLVMAQTAQRIENEQRGERLTVIDPPVINDEPVWPNRWLIMGAGFGGGLFLGLLLAFLPEVIFGPIRGPRSAANAAGGGELLGALPTIQARDELPTQGFWGRLFTRFRPRFSRAS